LNAGRLEQVGSPEDLYRRPESRFVATFIGRASTVPGVFEETVDGESWVTVDRLPESGVAGGASAGGAVRWSGVACGKIAREQPVDLIVKPEALCLASRDRPEALPGRLVERRFTGALTYCVVRLKNGREVEVLDDGPRDRQADDEVFVAPRGEGPRPRIFPAGGARREGDVAE
jgi:ABC-type Fe3+/spermidine/putrescine transport system ATPase subunit